MTPNDGVMTPDDGAMTPEMSMPPLHAPSGGSMNGAPSYSRTRPASATRGGATRGGDARSSTATGSVPAGSATPASAPSHEGHMK
eukprot:3069282-Prymnesium_polylepis.1